MANDRTADEELARFLDWPSPVFGEVAWADVETELGYRLPADFKALMSRFPSGTFADKFNVVSPVQNRKSLDRFREESAMLLNDLFEQRAFAAQEDDPDEDVPYAIYPEPGGLIPWGSGDEHAYYWLATDLAEPDGWTVVYSLRRDTGWGAYPGTMSKFLLDATSGRYVDRMLYYQPSPEKRRFYPYA